ncbi:MAG: hypothetical protein ACMXX5_00515 [Candidatus Woesearchaeota archaeon]
MLNGKKEAKKAITKEPAKSNIRLLSASPEMIIPTMLAVPTKSPAASPYLIEAKTVRRVLRSTPSQGRNLK